MSNLLPTPQGKDLATICADHTRRVQDLCVRFWHGDIDMWHYRKQSRELTQQFVNELQMLFNQSPASSNYPSSDTGLNQNIGRHIDCCVTMYNEKTLNPFQT